MSQSFLAKLDDAVRRNNSLVCVGIDPDPTMMPVPVEELADFCRNIVDATSDLVCAYKPNIAFFEALAEPGWEALVKTMSVIPPDIPIIIDAKRGDIGNTAAAYARAIFEVLGADATTVNPYCGTDAVEPFFEYSDKGIIVLCRSSNPSAVDFQDLEVNDKGTKRPLWQVVAHEDAGVESQARQRRPRGRCDLPATALGGAQAVPGHADPGAGHRRAGRGAA